MFRLMGLHAPNQFRIGEEARRILGAAGLGFALLLLAGLWEDGSLSGTALGRAWLSGVVLEVGSRRGFAWLVLHSRSPERRRVRALIVGTGEEATCLARRLRNAKTPFEPLGTVEPSDGGSGSDGLCKPGMVERVLDAVRKDGVECIFVSPAAAANGVLPLVRAGRLAEAEVRIVTELPTILGSSIRVEEVGGYAMLCLRPATLSGPKAAVKRAFDLVAATLALVLLLPLMAAAAAAIKLTSPGPVIYRQPRVTKGGRVFTMYKFRTMVTGEENGSAGEPIDPAVPYFKIREDRRVFKAGRVLRRLSIDELPQLVNVIRGDMSLVGPRPLWLPQVADKLEALHPRHDVRAGITGWWQVNGRSDLPAEDAFRFDAAYVESWSLSLDLYILLRTVLAVLSRRGAY